MLKLRKNGCQNACKCASYVELFFFVSVHKAVYFVCIYVFTLAYPNLHTSLKNEQHCEI